MNRVIRIKILSTCTHRLRILCEQLTTFSARPRGTYFRKICSENTSKVAGCQETGNSVVYHYANEREKQTSIDSRLGEGGGGCSEESMYLRLYSDAYPCHRHDRVETQIPLELRIFWDITHFRDTIDTITPPSSNLTTSE